MSIIIARGKKEAMDLEGGCEGEEGRLRFDRIGAKDRGNILIIWMNEIVEVVKDIYPHITIMRVDKS